MLLVLHQLDEYAELRNTGIELSLGATVLKTENFSFDIDLNFAKK